MSSHAGPFRTILTLLLALVMPLCCCNLQRWMGACEAASAPIPAGAAHARCPECSPSQDAPASTTSQGRQPPQPHEHCACSIHEGQVLPGGATVLDIPAPVMVAIMEVPATLPILGEGRLPHASCVHGVVYRPTSTLLRLHCALSV